MSSFIQLARGRFVNVEVSSENKAYHHIPQVKYAGILSNDSSFDDFMEKLANIRKKANLEVDV